MCGGGSGLSERERVVLREMGFGEGENNKKWKNNEYFIE